MSIADESGKVFKEELHAGKPKMGLFLNSSSPTIAEQLSCAGYDWLLVDMQHGPMDTMILSSMLCAIHSGGAKSMVQADRKVTPCAFLPWVDRVGGSTAAGRSSAGRQTADGRSSDGRPAGRPGGARVVSGAEKKII